MSCVKCGASTTTTSDDMEQTPKFCGMCGELLPMANEVFYGHNADGRRRLVFFGEDGRSMSVAECGARMTVDILRSQDGGYEHTHSTALGFLYLLADHLGYDLAMRDERQNILPTAPLQEWDK